MSAEKMEANALNILLTAGGLLICFFSGKWFTKVNEESEKTKDKLKDNELRDKEHQIKMERMDLDIKESEKRNSQMQLEISKGAKELQKDIGTLARSVDKLINTTSIQEIKITNTESKVKDIEEQNKFIADWIRDMKAKENNKK